MAAARDQNGSRKRQSKWDTPAPSTGSATDAAREAARKLNAMLAAKGKLTTNAPPPLLPPTPKSTAGTSSGSASTFSTFTEEVEINDSPRRLLLCQSNVQHEIHKYSGAGISTKGHYTAPAVKGTMTGQKPLYLFIQAPSRDKVNLAVQRIQGIMNGDDPFIPPSGSPQQSNQSSTLPSGMYYVQEKVFVGLDHAPPEFNLKEKILGPGESYFHHITKETGAKVHLRGRGSGFLEPTSGREAFEALYVYVSHTNYAGLGAAKKLVENLIQTVHTAYQQFQMQHTSNLYNPNYAGYPGQNNAGPPQRLPHMQYNTVNPSIAGYGPRPSSGGLPPSSYPYPPRHPQQYNQPGPDHNIPPNPQMPPPHAMYANPALRHEGPKPLMDQRPAYIEPQPPLRHPSTRYTPEPPTRPERPSSPLNHSSPPVPDRNKSKNEVPSSKAETKPTEPSKPAKRRFTEAPAKKTELPTLPESVVIEKQRSVSSLDQQSTQFTTPSGGGGDDDKRSGNMAPPVFAALKLKPSNDKKESTNSSDAFKMPLTPLSSVLSGAKKKPLGPPSKPTGKKRKLDEPDNSEKKLNIEKKSTGIALLGSYEDDSSDED